MTGKDNATPHSSGEYDEKVRKTIPFYDAFHDETIELVKAVGNPALWLDTGCGTGTLVEKAAAIFPTSRFLVADPSEAMLKAATARLSSLQDRVTFLGRFDTAGLAGRLDDAPDVITAIQSHHYLRPSGRRDVTRVCFDMLAPGGLYVTFENVRPLTERGIEICLKRARDYQLASGLSEGFAADHAKRFDTQYFPVTVEEHLALLRETGFSVVELFWFSRMQAGFYAIK